MSATYSLWADTPNVDAIEECRSYATRKALIKGIEKFGFEGARYLVVCNSKGRYTAVFPVSEAQRHGFLGVFASKGFMTFG